MLRTLALILAGGSAPALSILSMERAEAAIPFAGKFRIIDFSLSNCVNSTVYNVGVLTQYRPRSLHEHLGVGRPWDLDRASGGLRILHPSPTPEGGGWQKGTADALRYNLDFIMDQPVEHVLVLAGDHIYKMDYQPMIEMHRSREADITIGVHSVSRHEAYRYGIITTDPESRISSYVEKPRRPSGGMASMGVYVFDKEFLVNALAKSTETHLGSEMLPRLVNEADAYAYNFQGFWADVGTVQAYYETNLALLSETPALDMYDPEWIIHTQSSQQPGAHVDRASRVENSMISDGSQVYGNVSRSIISPGVVVSPDATVRDSIILNDAWIGPGAVIDRCIVDEDARIESGVVLGDGHDNTPNQKTPEWLNTGLTLVGMRTHIPSNVRVGRNVAILSRTNAEAFGSNKEVMSGATVGP
jgi:glucose-1-phosphate adenylyltransferase